MNPLLTPEQVADLLQVSVKSVYGNAHRLGGFYPAGIRCLRFRQEVINGIIFGTRPGGDWRYRFEYKKKGYAGVPHYGFHAIRHFVATYLHDIQKIPTGVIGTLLGHKSKRTTEIYLHPVDEAARFAVAKLEGVFDENMLSVYAVGFDGKGGKMGVNDRLKPA